MSVNTNSNMSFDDNVKNTNVPFAQDFSCPSSTLLIAFGGLAGSIGIPPFEFFSQTRSLMIKKIYIRDLYQVWYHNGLPGIANDIDSVAEFLRHKIKDHNIQRTVIIGNSMGGYAAILFGLLLHADLVHSFSPQTFINKFHRIIYWDRRWKREVSKIYKLNNVNKSYLNILKLFKIYKNNKTNFNIYYSSKDRLDTIHATRMSGIDNIHFHVYKEGGHLLIKHLRDKGLLKGILLHSITPALLLRSMA